MKANRKFLNGDNDEAVSPVIAVILMVAITVVLAATVYVWVSGFSGTGGSAKTIALNSNGPVSSGVKSYTVASASPGMTWADLKFTLDGTEHGISATPTSGCGTASPNPEATKYMPCSDGQLEASTDTVDAGDLIYIDASSGDVLRAIDVDGNSQLGSWTVS